MRRFMKALLLLVILGGLAFTIAFGWYGRSILKPGPLTEGKNLVIARGAGLSGIATQLEAEQVIANRYVFMIAARLSGANRSLKAGEYAFAPGISASDVVDKLARGDVVVWSVTIPEGLTSWQVVQLLKKQDGLEGDIAAIPSEGSLLPQTYRYMRGETRQNILDRMAKDQKALLGRLWQARDAGSPAQTPEQAVTLASVIEKETGVAAERKRVAGVFANRLKQGIPLQSDPTVIYALTKGEIQDQGQGPLGRRLLRKDLAFASPYNTYANPGLPPGPIANPGEASLEAALHPEQHDFLYFVADGKGGHVFAATLDGHNRNVEAWRKIRQAAD